MDDNDTFFTRTVIGPPVSVLMGRRRVTARSRKTGLEVRLDGPGERLSQAWRDWLVLNHDDDRPGTPRRRPTRVRRWLERHALLVAILGMLSLLSGALMMGFATWK